MPHEACNIQMQKKESVLRQKYTFPHRVPGIEASETSAAAAVQEFAERDCQAETDMGTEEANLHFPRRVSQISLADRGAGMQGSFSPRSGKYTDQNQPLSGKFLSTDFKF